MIDKQYGFYVLICDKCGEVHETNFEVFYTAHLAGKRNGWSGRIVNGFFYDWCPECVEDITNEHEQSGQNGV